MRRTRSDPSTFELLSSDKGSRTQTAIDDHYLSVDTIHDPVSKQRAPTGITRRPGIKQVVYVLPLLAAIIPIVLVAAYSPRFSRHLAYNACTPNGDFVLPFTTSIWDLSRLLETTVAFGSLPHRTCTVGAGGSTPLSCEGNTFTKVKVIDMAWDVLIGRGSQAVVVLFAYRLFSRILATLMKQGEVGYDAFAAIAFDSASTTPFPTLLRHAVGGTAIPRTLRAILAYWGMAAATLYIVAIPTLLSAIIGYTSYYAPYINFEKTGSEAQGSLMDCEGTFPPVWGLV